MGKEAFRSNYLFLLDFLVKNDTMIIEKRVERELNSNVEPFKTVAHKTEIIPSHSLKVRTGLFFVVVLEDFIAQSN